MTRFMAGYVRWVEAINYRIGRFAMYLIFAMMAVLLYSSFTKTAPFMRPSLWTLEVAQYLMVAFYMLGGAYAIQMGSNVRMDLLYGVFSPRRKAAIDAFTVVFLLVYLGFLLYGALDSLAYSLGNFTQGSVTFFGGLAGAMVTGGPDAFAEEIGVIERSRSAWRPALWPVKTVMLVGIVLMILQAVAEFFKDIERARTGADDPFGSAKGKRGVA